MIAGAVMVAGGAAAGLFGSLLGLGGGVLIVPLLTFGFGRPLREAVGVSLVCVIVTSSAAAGAYLRGRVANLRLGMVLALFTALGALVGGLVAFVVPDRALAGLFAILLAYVALSMARASRESSSGQVPAPESPVGARAESPPGALDAPGYRVRRVGPASVASVGAGIVAALLGIGGGAINVPTMHLVMGVPVRVATATSNLMIGVTAVASAIIYLLRGGIDPYIAGPTALGVFAGASVGARMASRVNTRVLRWLFVAVLGLIAVQMARRALAL